MNFPRNQASPDFPLHSNVVNSINYYSLRSLQTIFIYLCLRIYTEVVTSYLINLKCANQNRENPRTRNSGHLLYFQ